jgi:hypothetical protein
MNILGYIKFYSIQLFIYLRAELNSQWPITAQIQTTGLRQHRTKQTNKQQQNKEK